MEDSELNLDLGPPAELCRETIMPKPRPITQSTQGTTLGGLLERSLDTGIVIAAGSGSAAGKARVPSMADGFVGSTRESARPVIVHANVETRIKRDLAAALSRLRQLGGAMVVVELTGAIGGSSTFADEVDQIQVTASRDVGLATRELLLERVNRLSAALERLNEGEYGVCVGCAEPIATARLDAVPEVETCVRCQAGLERLGREADRSPHRLFAVAENDESNEAIHPSHPSSAFPREETAMRHDEVLATSRRPV